jgi:hypothetical protein
MSAVKFLQDLMCKNTSLGKKDWALYGVVILNNNQAVMYSIFQDEIGPATSLCGQSSVSLCTKYKSESMSLVLIVGSAYVSTGGSQRTPSAYRVVRTCT